MMDPLAPVLRLVVEKFKYALRGYGKDAREFARVLSLVGPQTMANWADIVAKLEHEAGNADDGARVLGELLERIDATYGTSGST